MNRKHDAIQRENNNFNSSIRQFLSKVGRAAVNKDHKNTLEVKAAKLGILVLTLMHPEVLIHFVQLILPLKITPKRITPWKILLPRELSPRILPPSKLTRWSKLVHS